MPTYTYLCQGCAAMEDAYRKIDDRDTPPDFCGQCGKTDLRRMQAAPQAVWKCGGSHAHDYTKHGPRKG